MRRFPRALGFVVLLNTLVAGYVVPADAGLPASAVVAPEVLTPRQWSDLQTSVTNGLAALARNQSRDGTFRGPTMGQPGITSLSVLAFLSGGHLPGDGSYRQTLDRAVDYVLETQQPNGLFSELPYRSFPAPHEVSRTALYNHAIAGLMLCEIYGMMDPKRNERIREAIPKALKFSYAAQGANKRRSGDKGGWKYFDQQTPSDSDLSVTTWQLMFLRSAKNAEFDVAERAIDQAMDYVRRCFDERRGVFRYGLYSYDRTTSRGIVGAGVFSLSMGGQHETEMAKRAGKWIAQQSFDRYNRRTGGLDRYHYSAYYCCQAMFQLGGNDWAQFFPPLAETLLANQRPDGTWAPEAGRDSQFGNTYTTALVVLTLTPPYQILPIYQR